MKKFLNNKTSKFNNYFTVIGAFLGTLILFCSIQFYFDLKQLLIEQTDSLSSDYLVIQKPVSALNTLGVSSSEFTNNEINKIKEQRFIKDVAPFKGSNFEASIEYKASQNIPGFYTLIFFESLPDRFIDVKTENWNWDNPSDVVPVIIPQNFIDLFNFGIGDMQGLPKIYDGLLNNLEFNIYGSGKGKRLKFVGKFEGFSDRINTVLVPESFIDYCNSELSSISKKKSSRIIIETTDSKNPQLKSFLESNNYQTNKEKLKGSMQTTIIRVILLVFLLIGVIIIFLSVINFIQNANIIIAKSSENIRKLILIGVNHKNIASEIFKDNMIKVVLINFSSVIFSVFLSGLFQKLIFSNLGIEMDFNIYLATILVFIVLNIGLFFILKLTISKMISKEI